MKNISTKASDIFICAICLALSLVFCGILIFGEHEDFSEKENRVLQKLPNAKISNIIDGSFFGELSDFCSDQFPARSFFSSLSTASELSLGRYESNGIIIADDSHLLARHDYEELDTFTKNLRALSTFIKKQTSNGTPSFLLVAPRAIDVSKKELPALFSENYGEAVYQILHQEISSQYLIDPLPRLRELSSKNENVWYRTDHHWTTYGAYNAYLILGEELGIKTYPEEYFEVNTICNDFLGTSYSKAALPYFSTPDTIELYRYDFDEKISVIHPTTEKSTLGFYDMSALVTTDKYSVFLGGNSDLLQIRDRSKDKPRLLLIKDSFANSIIPFLALHYDIDVIDLRYYRNSLENYISENRFDTILAVYGIDTLASDVSCSNIAK